MRYRARPSFTVEVKRNNKRLPLTVTTADSDPSERRRVADQLLFGGLPTRPPGPEPQRPVAAAAVTSKPNAEVGRAQRLMGRILPDLLGETRAELRLHQELEEKAARLRAQRDGRKASPSFGPTRANTQAGDEADAGRETVLDATSAAKPLRLEEPVLAAMEVVEPAAVEPVTAVSLSSPDRSFGQTSKSRGRRERKGFQAGRHGADRQGTSAVLRAGEKWKRRLPRVCW